MKKISLFLTSLFLVFAVTIAFAEGDVPKLLNFQGRVSVDGQPFTGTGQFKFALISLDGLTTYWSNDDTSVNGSEPSSGVAVFVRDGIYSVVLGGSGMTPIPETVFTNNSDVSLRVWFNDGTYGFEQLEPDQRILSVGYAVRASVADTVKDSGRIIISGEIDSRDQGDETYDLYIGQSYNYSTWQMEDIYSRQAVKNIPVAELDISDMPMVNIYYASSAEPTEWHEHITGLITKEGGDSNTALMSQSYLSYRILNNQIKLSYPHLKDRDDPISVPFISYVSGSPSYNVFYKIVIVK